jgi:regulatory factor X
MEIAEQPEISLRVDEAMGKAYNHFLSLLLDKLISTMPNAAQTSLRNLGNNLQTIMEQSMQNFSSGFCEPKIELSVRLGHLFQRFLALYQLTAALAPMISDPKQVQLMESAWDNLDDQSIFDQCALSSECRPELLSDIMIGFSIWLSDCEASPSNGLQSMDKLGNWIQGLVDSIRGPNLVSRG